MAIISKIVSINGTQYDIADAVARQTLAGAIKILGKTTTPLTDGATTNPITIGGNSVTAVANDAVFYNKGEFVFDGTNWNEFGDMSGLGELAKKDSASGSYTPEGTVSQPNFTGDELTSTGNITAEGTVSQPTFSGTKGNVSVKGTPAGDITVQASDSGNYTPAGNVGAPNITLKTAGSTGTVTPIADIGSLPSLTMTVENETLTFSFDAGTLPSKGSDVTVKTGDAVYQADAPAFTGSKVQIDFAGDELTSGGEFTPAGTVSQPTFSGSSVDVSVTGTPSGTVSQPTFSGTAKEITVS